MKESILFGTYTKKTSTGIYRAQLDTVEKQVSNVTPYIKVDNPTYLTKSDKNTLYTVSKRAGLGGLSAFNLASDEPVFLNDVSAEGAPPAYVAVDNARQLVYSSNYHKGLISISKIEADGSLSLISETANEGHGPKPEQTSSHIHFTDLTPDNRLVVCDLGTDQVLTFDVTDNGAIKQVAEYRSEPGFGSRHIVFHKNGQLAYLAGELSSEVSLLSYNQEDGSFKEIQTLSSIPADWDAHNGIAAIRISKDSRFLYVSNRGNNSIACYSLADDGKMTLIQLISTEGDFPRDFSLNKSEQFLVVANQNTDNATLFERDATSGMLTLIQKEIAVPESVCVYFEN
ncbi:lactonase family protein [Dellaglioa sp. BT-FLS60]